MNRVVSLIASSTEIICALGRRDQMVGRSHECDYPPSVRDLPVCSEPKIDIHSTSGEIDQQVRELVSQGLSVYRVHAEKLKRLKPDIIVTQDHCEVCAVSLKDVELAVHGWLDAEPTIVSLRPNNLTDVWESIRQVADALCCPETGEKLVRQAQIHINTIARQAQSFNKDVTVACIEWLDPLMAAGNWVPELVKLAGARNVFGRPGKHAPQMTWEELCEKDPDVIITMPCGWDMEQTKKELPVLTEKSEWRHLKAVKQDQVFLTDGNQYFNRPGPRLVDSLEILTQILHPDIFPGEHKGYGWDRL